MEVERAVRVLDGAVAIVDAVAGVQAQTETVWRQADRYKVPRIAYVNKMDREGASLQSSVESLRTRLQANPLVVQLPVGASKGFRAVIDVLTLELIEWSDDDFGSRLTRYLVRYPRLQPLNSPTYMLIAERNLIHHLICMIRLWLRVEN
jgi:translation elongation factor EF-G